MFSVVIPCYNEAAVFPALARRLQAAAAGWGPDWEVIFVDDGSRDDTWRLFVAQHAADPHFKGINLSRNFGHQTAVSAGLAQARGDCVAVLDADLQDPPEELARFIAKWKEGFEVVYAVRTRRKEPLLHRLCYALFYRLLARTANIEIPRDAGDFCVMDRRVVAALNAMPERNRFVRGLRAWTGFRQVGLEYERQARAAGTTQYSFWKLTKLATDGLFAFSTVPLRLATWLGLIVSLLSFLGIALVVFQRLFPHAYSMFWAVPPAGWASGTAAMLFLGGVGLICLGIIGEYLARIYEEVQQRPRWLIREQVGLAAPADVLGSVLPSAAAVPTLPVTVQEPPGVGEERAPTAPRH